MIIASNGNVSVHGDNVTILAEFCSIVESLLIKEVADWDNITFCMNMVKEMVEKSQGGDEE